MSSPIDPYIPLLGYLGVWALIVIIGTFLKADQHGLTVKPYYLMLRTGVFNKWMERLGSRFRRAWLTYFDIGAAMGVGLIVFVFYTFIVSVWTLYNHTSQEVCLPGACLTPGSIVVPLPGLTIGWNIFPYILISLAVLLIPHEAAHGIASVIDKVPLKSSGLFLGVFLGGAFVEVDEEDLAKRRARTKLRVFAAGSYTNIVTWFIVLLTLTNFVTAISPLYAPNSSGVLITRLANGGAAQQSSIPTWSVLTQINGTSISDVQALHNFLAPLSPGHHLVLTLKNLGDYTIMTQPASDNSSRATIGIFTFNYYQPRASFLPVSLPFHFWNTLQWMYVFLLGVAVVNMLPMVPFDGDKYFDAILTRIGLKDTKRARTVASTISLLLLGTTFILSFLTFGTVFPR